MHACPYNPMLAHTYTPGKTTIPGNLCIQPKLDGVRCIAMWGTAGLTRGVLLWSRNGKPLHCKAISDALHPILSVRSNMVLDGELYMHGWEFQDIQSISSRQNPRDPDKAKLQYHIYDCLITSDPDLSFVCRHMYMVKHLKASDSDKVHIVDTQIVGYTTERRVNKTHDHYASKGYEGIMLRNADSPYQQKRTKDLLKFKKFLEEDYVIADIEPGQGKNYDCAVLVCTEIDDEGVRFSCTAPGNYDNKRDILLNKKKYIGATVTVKYQNKTKDGVPRFPVALGIKDDR